MRRLLVTGAAVLLVVLAGVPVARGCDCASTDPRAALARAAGAFVGSLVAPPPSGEDEVPFEFRVESAVKGDLGASVTVWSRLDSAGCGLSARVGQRVAMFLGRDDSGRWTSSLCAMVDPEELLRATAPLPAPDGAGPPALVVAGTLGDVQVLALDERGRTLAYGTGEGETSGLAVCPGGARVVVSATLASGGTTVTVRDLPSLAVVRTRELVRKGSWPYGVGCGDRAGDDVYALFARSSNSTVIGFLLRAHRDDPVTEVWSGPGTTAGFDPGGRFAFVAVDPPALVRVELPTGQARQVAPLPEPAGHVAVDPAGRSVAVLGRRSPAGPSTSTSPRLATFAADGTPRAERVLEGPGWTQVLAWSSGDLLTVARNSYGPARSYAETFDAHLRPKGQWGEWVGSSAAGRAGHIYAVGHDGKVRIADAVRGGPTVWRELPGRHLPFLAAVPPEPPPKPPRTTTTAAPPPTVAEATTSTSVSTTATTAGERIAVRAASSDRDRPGAAGGVAGLALLVVSAATALVARRSVRRSGLPAAHGTVR